LLGLAHIAKAGTQVIIPYRDEDDKRHLKVTGDLGQIVSMVRFSPSIIFFFFFLDEPQCQRFTTTGMGHPQRGADRRMCPTL
jgi:hypothetical protein